MTVAELIARLSEFPQDVHVSINDERGGRFHEIIDDLLFMDEDDYDPACVVLVVNRDY